MSLTHPGLLGHRGFRWLLGARIASQTGDGLAQVGMVGLLFFDASRQTTPAGAAAAFAATLLPYTLLGPAAGVALDRWDRRRVILVANTIRAVVVLGIAALTVGGNVGPALVALALIALGLNRFFLSGQTAGIPHVVPSRLLVTANAATPTIGTLAATAGAWGGAAVLAAVGSRGTVQAGVLVAAALAYLVSSVFTAGLRHGELGPDVTPDVVAPPVRLFAGLAAGVEHIRRHVDARQALLTIAGLRTAVGLSAIATLVLCRNHLAETTEGGLALATTAATAATVGAGIAAVLTPWATRRFGASGWTTGALLGAAVVALGLAFAPNVATLLATSAFLGLAAMTTKVEVDSVLQSRVEDAFRGRVFAVYDAVANATFVFAAVLAVFLVSPSGHSVALFLGVSTALAAGALSVHVRGLRTPALTALPGSH